MNDGLKMCWPVCVNEKISQQMCLFRNDEKIIRESEYYFWKVMVVLFIVTLTAMAAIIGDNYLDQVTHLSTVLLTDIAYLYTIQDDMPKLKYLTHLDHYVMGNITFVFLIYVQVTVMEKLNVNMGASVLGEDGFSTSEIVLAANLAALGLFVAAFCVTAHFCRQRELKKLGKIPDQSERMEEEHEVFECNAFCGGPDQTLLLP